MMAQSMASMAAARFKPLLWVNVRQVKKFSARFNKGRCLALSLLPMNLVVGRKIRAEAQVANLFRHGMIFGVPQHAGDQFGIALIPGIELPSAVRSRARPSLIERQAAASGGGSRSNARPEQAM